MKNLNLYIIEKFKISKNIKTNYFESGDYIFAVLLGFGNKKNISLELFYPFKVIEWNDKMIKYETSELKTVEFNLENKEEEKIKSFGLNSNKYFQIDFNNLVSSIAVFFTQNDFLKFIKDIFPEFDIDKKYVNNPLERVKIDNKKLKDYFDIPDDKKIKPVSSENQYLTISNIYKEALKYAKH